MINKSYKIRLYPNKEQGVLLCKTFGCSCLVWNVLLDKNIKGYEASGKEWKQDYNTTLLKKDLKICRESLSITAVEDLSNLLLM